MRRLLSLLVLAAASLIAGGCVTAGLAVVGPLAGSLTALADRSVDRTMPADLGTTWGATADALARMAVRVEHTEKSEAKWRLTGMGEAVTVHGTLERVTAGMTRVSVRVEAGGLFADKQTGDELLNQIAASLATLASAGRSGRTEPNPDASTEQLRRLHREIERLGTKIEQARETPAPAIRPEATPAASVSPGQIVVIPTSAGVATVPAIEVSVARPTARSAAAVGASRPASGPPGLQQASEPSERDADNVVAQPMSSVEVLRPVEALHIRPVRE